MFILFDKIGDILGFKALIDNAISKGAKGMMVFSCDDNHFDTIQINNLLIQIKEPIWGGIFPEIIHKGIKYTKGTTLLAFKDEIPNVNIIKNISNPQTNIAKELSHMSIEDFQTMFVYVDAFSITIQRVIEELYFEFGLESNFIGGGAGSLSFIQKPCLFTNEGLLEDALVLASINHKSGVGVKHGWHSISANYQVTSAKDNTIIELDYRPAFEVYKEIVEKHSGKLFKENDFFDIAKGYPFGISTIGKEMIVRDPIKIEDNHIICVGNINEGVYINILNGKDNALISAAQEAYEIASSQINNIDVTLFIDCISRVLYLEDSFLDELEGVAKHNKNMIGALTLGEIANTKEEYLEFYNKTAVVSVF